MTRLRWLLVVLALVAAAGIPLGILRPWEPDCTHGDLAEEQRRAKEERGIYLNLACK